MQMARLYMAVRKDPRTSALAKYLPLLSIVYLLWPFDLIPDFLPLLGQIDDVLMLPLLIYLALSLVQKNVKDDAQKKVIDIEPHRR
jgi:uncharacterized membrane protein YkvA (DUF1232 family)